MSTKPEFGVSSSTRGRGGHFLGSTRANKSFQRFGLPTTNTNDPTNIDQRFENARRLDDIEDRFGFERYQEGPERLGWLLNMHACIVEDSDWAGGRAGVNYYFINDNGETFKTQLVYSPYFYIGCKPGTEGEVEDLLSRQFENVIEKMSRLKKEDLKKPNHLIGKKETYIQLSFRNVSDLLSVRRVLLPVAQKNQKKTNTVDIYTEHWNSANNIHHEKEQESRAMSARKNPKEALDHIIDIREYDVPYYVRVAIDLDIRVGLWYTAKAQQNGTVVLTKRTDLVHRPEPVIFAFDIETTKLPLKFPDVTIDSIMMISYMIDGRGYLITNRDIVSQDIEDFDYTPKPEFEGPFTIFNEENEEALLQRFFEHIKEAKPNIYVTYNGDFFDWPFVEGRAKAHGIDMYHEIGVYKDDEDEYKCKHATHMDAFRWVKRDSYLPQGSQGLKAVTTAKLGYNPMELDPEDMTRFANEKPQTLAQYSVSDAVATYYLYMKYVHPFIYSLCNIIPLVPDEVLRKGTGTLCELLLMVEAYRVNVIMPNKHVDKVTDFYEGHLLESETYVGGHVEALEAGVFRSDINSDFKVDPTAAQQLIDQLDDALKFTIEVEEKKSLDTISNYDQVKQEIQQQLEALRDKPMRQEPPLIYHLDVAAMYPNIILTNRLQPDAMIDESVCSTCEFNMPGKNCDRRMKWLWRGEYIPAKMNEYKMIENQLTLETFPPKTPNGPQRNWNALSESEKSTLIRTRLTEYSRKVYKKVRETKTIERESIICQRENPFYIETVRAFRDRRYEYKGLHKTWKGKLDNAASEGSATKVAEAKNMIVLYDSLQLAHKCILNSFYGYVMRKGARWHSLEMAGIVCLTGSKIIQMARQLVERIGRPLELDTDGIWCILPKSFPETFTFEMKNGKKFRIDYPCTMLNHLVHAEFTNDQYQRLKDPKTFEYEVSHENSIFFEIDGPYRAMILPSSTAEDKLLKKRYAVFNKDGSLAELKGFEVKRRGELKLIKIFQTEIFKVFLDGKTLEECYASVAAVADRWLDILFSKAVNLTDEELFDLISENRSMSKTLEEYGSQKSTSISTAKRLAEFLGDQMVKDKGLACKFIISARPYDVPVSERAIPVTIFQAEPSVKKNFLRKWLRDNSLNSFDIRDILDWDYYVERFGSVIQKLITIPAAMQKVRNPVPRVKHPEWLFKRVAAKDDKFKQHRITDMFSRTDKPLLDENMEVDDIEELNITGSVHTGQLPKIARVNKRVRGSSAEAMDIDVLAPEDEPANMPDMHENYSEWLEFQKRKWKRQRLVRARNRETLGNTPQNSQGVGGYFRRQTGSILTSIWQVLQIAETETPGEFRVWLLAQDQLVSIRVLVPRVLYVNTKDEEFDISKYGSPLCDISKSARTLPRSHKNLNLFQMTMTENNYQQEQSKYSGIFNDTATEGVYETKIPLSVRAILELGATCQYKGTRTKQQHIEDRFDLHDIVQRTDVTSDYITDSKDFHYLYLFHAHSDNRHFYAIMGAQLTTSRVCIVGLSKRSQQLPNITKMFRDRLEEVQMNGLSQTVELSPQTEFEVSYHSLEQDALKAINSVLTKYHESKRVKVVLAISSQRTSAHLIQYARGISLFPFVRIPSLQQDNKFDPLNWAQPIAKRMIKHYLELGTWIDEKISQARYANIPFCNIPDDPYLFMCDVIFARRLMKNEMVLWWSPSQVPDLGGREEDDNQNTIDEISDTEMSFPNAYENVCVEMDILRLCVNTLIVAPVINEIEGTGRGNGFDGASYTLDEYTSGNVNTLTSYGEGMISGKTFSMLRGIVQEWFAQVFKSNSELGVHMIDTLHRWLLSTSSNMYDPSLYALVHNMMKKVFIQLVAEFKRLGATIVFANFHKIVLSTGKETMDRAQLYFNYLHRSIQTKQVFEILDFKTNIFWDVLLWMDEMNYAGVVYDGDKPTDQPIITKLWNIESYLPVAAQDMFSKQIAGYIYRIYQLKREFPHRISDEIKEPDNTAPSPRITELQTFVKRDMMRKNLNWLRLLVRKQDQQSINHDPDLEFPKLAGSHLNMESPALEYVKSLCAVLNLDTRVEDEVRILKRSALATIGGVSDFSSLAQFRNPCEYFKLTEIICSYCNYTADLDFCRDKDLLPVNGKAQPWKCKGCMSEYDKLSIEERMITYVKRWLTAYQLQDLRCQRCRLVKRDNLALHCDKCGNEYSGTQSKADVERKLRVFRNVAHEQKLVYLTNVVEWCLERL